ncbi:ISL3 family transposase [Pseudarthrobacter sp. J47]|uniref:ISL3 family transposase n=1 Tax=Pseudarthrobacter sp. J47 TaxID=3116482 RepID=UPI002E823BAB|nr:ISL3 family transposase [Pseudarthrobacter sp. J47]MEE2521551.1 ISL3 family transposase [Pseudarthrobacter sp. J47]MEE2523601.1 ISL3 family transposase [Pseudarthrobacter sp. J47]MEE2524589.1 ISL3 family transposase [Pseudarthrobacter sp. J47]MEE2524630.1 ISL3 family transposase [Pseudarthrobacter sp. J47]MEE2524663.1 ISL3 family transposase [Pseudarthrobacter sp. J47]
MCLAFNLEQDHEPLNEPTGVAADAATILFNLPDYHVVSTTVTAGCRQVIVETDQPPGCPSCGVISSRRKERRFQRLRDIPVAGPVEVLWSKYRWYCQEVACDRLSFFESTPQVPRRARSTGRLRDQLVDAVIRSGRAVSDTAAGFAVSWWMVRAALNEACLLRLPDVDKLSPRMLGIDEHRFRSVRYFQDPATKAWTRFEPWMTTIVDLDTGQVLGVVDGRDHKGVGDWLFVRPLEWRLGVQVVAIDPSAAFRKALRMWLPRTAVAVDHFHLISLANQAMTETRQNLSQQVKGRRGRAVDKAWAHRMLLLRGGDTLSCRAALKLEDVFAADDPTGTLQAVWKVKEQLRALLRTGSLEDAATAKEHLEELVKAAARPETNRLYRTVCRWWQEIEVLIITGATTGKVEANNTAIKNIKRTARGYRNPSNYKSVILLRSAVRTAA